MTPRALLQSLMDAQGLNPNSLSAKTGGKTKQPQIFRFLSGEAKEPRRSTLAPVAKYFDVPVDAFFDEKTATALWDSRFSPEAKKRAVAIADLQERIGEIDDVQAKYAVHRAAGGEPIAFLEPSRPPVIDESEWKSLSPRVRALVEDTARQGTLGNLSDQQAKLLHDMLEQFSQPSTNKK